MYWYKWSIDTTMEYIAKLAKQPTGWSVNGARTQYPAPRQVTVSPSFYRALPCEACGQCCECLYNIWFIQEKAEHPVSHLSEYGNFKVNGIEVPIMYEKHLDMNCPYQDKGLCGVQSYKPLICQMPPIKAIFDKYGDTRIGKQKYPYRWHIGKICKVKIMPFSLEEFKSDIATLERVMRISHMLEIPSHLEEIIPKLKGEADDRTRQLTFSV